MSENSFPALLQGFFTQRLLQQRKASPHTVAAYRNTFRLLLRFASSHLDRPPSQLSLDDLDTEMLGSFLEHLERERGNSARTRNARLAAIHAFFRYVALTDPTHALLCQRVLAIPSKRFERGLVEFLDDEQLAALLEATDRATWFGRRDHALILVDAQTGLRVSELIALRHQDVGLGRGAHVRCLGKGRKFRCTPLRRDEAGVLEAWMAECCFSSDAPVFPSARGGHLSPDAIERLIAKHASTAARFCPSLATKRITPHTLRHSAAMSLLRNGVDRSVIALWLGHESIETTQMYLHADMRMKEQALARTSSSNQKPQRYQPDDALLAFLDGL